jgi:hypothetical protein
MLRILCDPLSWNTELRLTEPVVCVCVRSVRTVHTHHRFRITLPNTDQAHDKISVNHYE